MYEATATAQDLHHAFTTLIGRTITLTKVVRFEQIIEGDNISYLPVTRAHTGVLDTVTISGSHIDLTFAIDNWDGGFFSPDPKISLRGATPITGAQQYTVQVHTAAVAA